jgi:hypothetical protein
VAAVGVGLAQRSKVMGRLASPQEQLVLESELIVACFLLLVAAEVARNGL